MALATVWRGMYSLAIPPSARAWEPIQSPIVGYPLKHLSHDLSHGSLVYTHIHRCSDGNDLCYSCITCPNLQAYYGMVAVTVEPCLTLTHTHTHTHTQDYMHSSKYYWLLASLASQINPQVLYTLVPEGLAWTQFSIANYRRLYELTVDMACQLSTDHVISCVNAHHPCKNRIMGGAC